MSLVKREYTDKETVITAENMNDIQDAVIALEAISNPVIGEASGHPISLADASGLPFFGLTLYGKTTQDGTPAPNAPVEMVSVGNSGSIILSVTGVDDAQSMAVSTPNGLPGIPVSSGGNYTDANGQQWVCDEVDFARGVYVKRINVVHFENALGWKEAQPIGSTNYRFSFSIEKNPEYLPSAGKNGMCNALTYNHAPINQNDIDNSVGVYSGGGVFVRCDTHETIGDFVAWAKSIGLKVQYILAAPIETHLPEEEIAAYAALHTYRKHTAVSNDAGACM